MATPVAKASYSGGEALPAVGSPAYAQAQQMAAAAPAPTGVQFSGGSSLPPVGSAAYNQAVNYGGNGTGSYNPATGQLSISPTSPTATPTSNPMNIGTSPSTSPTSPTATGGINPLEPTNKQPLPNNNSQFKTQVSTGNQAVDISNKYKQGLAATTGSGISAPNNGGAASAFIAQNTPKIQDVSGVDTALQNDKGYQQLLANRAQYNETINQRKSLTDTYKQLTSEAGIPALNTELMNMKNVIEGTEDDIRNEITKAGGFATESQVMALTSSRNKQLIKNYNNLLETKNMAMQNVTTMMGLAEKDQAFALDSISKKMQFDEQLISYRDKFVDNARNAYQKIADKIGYAGLAKMVNATGDPDGAARVEQTLGLPNGGLAQLAAMPDYTNSKVVQLSDGRDVLIDGQGNIIKTIGGAKGTGTPAPKIEKINGVDMQWNPTSGKWETPSTSSNSDSNSNIHERALALTNINDTSSILKSPALSSTVGPNFLSRFISSKWNEATGATSEFIASVEQLRGQLTLDNLISAKARGATFGALSEGELKLLASSASKLGTWAIPDGNGGVKGYKTSEKNFKAEIDKINNFAKLDYILKGGDPLDVGAQLMPDGKIYTKNSEGNFVLLR